MRRARLIPLLLCAVHGAALSAQVQWSSDVGVSHLRQAGLPESNAATLGVTLDYAAERFAVRSTALGARTSDSRATGQWLGIGVVESPAWRSLALRATGALSAFGQSHLRPTSSADVVAQLRAGDGTRGIAVGGGFGATSHNAVTIPEQRAAGDAWWAFGRERVALSAGATRTRAVFGESSILVDLSNTRVDYLDIGGSWRHESSTWSLGAAAGARGRGGSFESPRAWQSLDAAVWMSSHTAVALSVGRTLEDLVRGVPRAEYATIALRLTAAPHLSVFARRRPAGPRVTIEGTAAARRISLVGIEARTVELMADFTNWTPVALARNGAAWTYAGAVPSGPHRLAIRIDGGEWIAPPSLPKVEDDLGGVVGIVTIP